MNEMDEKLERLVIWYWMMASIPAGARKGYVKGYLDGVLDALKCPHCRYSLCFRKIK